MAINKNVFLHESDKAALEALEAIPGFTQLMRSYLKSWNEKLFYIQNMSTNIQITDRQLKKYHDMLPPICEKLGIEVPDLFLQLNPIPNAYTSGDSKPFIVMTSGLLETLPEELIPTVLAHECGHIACHHVLYRTMGQMILNGAIFSLLGQGISMLLTYPLRAAFFYWMRCSEFSADRAAILCDGTPDKMVEVCARLAGFGKNIPAEINMDAFIEQSEEYQKLINESKLNKTMEFVQFGNSTHPINVLRVSEALKWAKTENFNKAKEYFDAYNRGETPKEIPVPWDEKHFLGKDSQEVVKELENDGFHPILTRTTEKNIALKEGTVTGVSINGSGQYKDGDWIATDAKTEVTYYSPLSEEEIRAMHPGQVRLPNAYTYYIGKDRREAEQELFEAGVLNTRSEAVHDLKRASDRSKGKVADILINGKTGFKKNDWIDLMDEVVIVYHEVM